MPLGCRGSWDENGTGIAVHSWSDEELDGLRRVGDPYADAVVAAYVDERAATSSMDVLRYLARREQGPIKDRSSAVEEYLLRQPSLPAWADIGQIRAAEGFFLEWGRLISLLHYSASLPSMYAMGRGVKVLSLTARLSTDTGRRIHETGNLIESVMAPGGLAVGAAGYCGVRRVRLMHAAVRHLILHDSSIAQSCDQSFAGRRWCADWGVPINQEDLLATLMSFTWVVFQSLARAGAPVTDRDAESYLHAWNVAAHLLGIRDDLLPVDLAAAPQVWAAITRRQLAASSEGKEMASALVQLLQDRMPRGLRRLPAAQIRYFAGDEVADALGLERAVPAAVFGPMRRAVKSLAPVAMHDKLLRMAWRHAGRIIARS